MNKDRLAKGKSINVLFQLFIISLLVIGCTGGQVSQGPEQDKVEKDDPYTIAAYVWPAYHPEPRMKEFYRGDDGEWERIYNAVPKWEGHDQPRQPLWGHVYENDPKVMEMKIETAHKYGVDVFIYDWYWFEDQPYLEEALNEGFLKAKNNHLMKFYLMWANHDANTSWDIERSHDQVVIWPGAVSRPIFDKLVDRFIEKYFKHPSYFKIDGKPVFSIYHLDNLLDGLGGVEPTIEAIQYFRDKVVEAGFPGLHIQVTSRNWLVKDISGVDRPNKKYNLYEAIKSINANSITSYVWVHHAGLGKPPGKDYVQWGMEAWEDLLKIDSAMNIPYYMNVSIGWDNNPRFVEKKGIALNTNPKSFEAFLMKAKQYVDERPDQYPMITINSWNEWVEGSYLEPDMRWGYGYLEAVEKVFGNK